MPAAPKPLPPVWLGVFDPKLPAHPPWEANKLTPVAHGGSVRVLTPPAGPAASDAVVVVHPLLGKIAAGTIDRGSVALAQFGFDQRDGDEGVLVLPGGTQVSIVMPTKADVAGIRAALGRASALANVPRALDGLELAAIDVDGDGVADFAATYGCAIWFDGACQSNGQFFLVRRGGSWAIVE